MQFAPDNNIAACNQLRTRVHIADDDDVSWMMQDLTGSHTAPNQNAIRANRLSRTIRLNAHRQLDERQRFR